MLSSILSMSYYTNPTYLGIWSKIMMPGAGAPPMSFYYYSLGFNILAGVFFAVVFSALACCIGGKDKTKKGALFGLAIFLVAGLPGLLSMYLLINLPLALIIIWAFEGLIINLIAGVAVAHIIK